MNKLISVLAVLLFIGCGDKTIPVNSAPQICDAELTYKNGEMDTLLAIIDYGSDGKYEYFVDTLGTIHRVNSKFLLSAVRINCYE